MSFFHDITEKNPEIGRITFKSVTSGKIVSLPAFITAFNDNFTIGFGGETTFGRNDPVKHYQSTSRQISVNLDIVAVDGIQAAENFTKYSQLLQMCYPVYSAPIGNSNNARTIKAPPIWRIKYANYISHPDGRGLLGTIGGLSFVPKFEMGHFIDNDNRLIPVVYNMSLNFQPIHEATLGFDEQGNFLEPQFPYGFSTNSLSATQIKKGIKLGGLA